MKEEDAIKMMEEQTHTFIVEVCELMYKHGYSHVSLGAVMRLIGVSEPYCQKHDSEYIDLDEEFVQYLEEKRIFGTVVNGTIH